MDSQNIQGPTSHLELPNEGVPASGANPPSEPALNYRSVADDRLQERRVAEGCFAQLFATFVTLGCLVGFFTFAWLSIALLLLTMYPQPSWTTGERVWVGLTFVMTGVAAVVCFLGALRSSPIRWHKGG